MIAKAEDIPSLSRAPRERDSSRSEQGEGAYPNTSNDTDTKDALTPALSHGARERGQELPPHIDHELLLAEFTESDLTLTDLARAHGLTLAELAAWLDHPQTQHDLATYARLAQIRAAITEPAARHRGLAALTTLAETNPATEPQDPALRQRAHETARKAATKLLNHMSSTSPKRKRGSAPLSHAPRDRDRSRSEQVEGAYPNTSNDTESTDTLTPTLSHGARERGQEIPGAMSLRQKPP